MQRQLDNDLSASEIEILMTHTRQCPACAAMFERLKLLSAELTSLPKVTPSYSLVDAIMPELERIDRMAQSEGSVSYARQADDDSVQLSAAAPLQRRKRQRRWMSWSAFGGAVAAGIVAGIFLMTYPPAMNSDNAAADSANMMAADVANSAGRKMGAMDAKTDSGAQASQSESAGEEPYADSTGHYSKSIASDDGIHELNNENGEVGSGTDSSHEYYQFDIAEKPDESTDSVDQNGAPIADSSSVDGGEQGNKGMTEGSADDTDEEATPNMALVPPEEFASRAESPNGAYVARIVDHAIAIFSKDGKQLTKTTRKNGELGNLLWSEDSAQLSYEVRLEQGATEKYIIEASNWQEAKAVH